MFHKVYINIYFMKYLKKFNESSLGFSGKLFRECDYEEEVDEFIDSNKKIPLSENELIKIKNIFNEFTVVPDEFFQSNGITLSYKMLPSGIIMSIEKYPNNNINGYYDDCYLILSAVFLPTNGKAPHGVWGVDNWGDQVYYIADNLDGLEEFSEFVRKEWIRNGEMVNESVGEEEDEDMIEVDESEYSNWIYYNKSGSRLSGADARRVEKINTRERSLIKNNISNINKLDTKGVFSYIINYNVVEYSSWINISYKPKNSKSLYGKRSSITKYEDGWFLCSFSDCWLSNDGYWNNDDENIRYFICDQVTGLELFFYELEAELDENAQIWVENGRR
jgi:hypothetical protein